MVGGMLLVISAVLTQGAAFFGYAKPTPVNPMNLSGGRRGEAWVSAAGPLSNLIMAAHRRHSASTLHQLRPVRDARQQQPGPGGLLHHRTTSSLINVFLFIFNLIPVPPLDGWRVLLGLVPSQTAWQLRQIEIRYAQMIPFVFLLFIFLLAPRVIGPDRRRDPEPAAGLLMAGWWAGKTRQFRRYLTGSVSATEREALVELADARAAGAVRRDAPRRPAPRPGRGGLAARGRARGRRRPAAGRPLPRRGQGTDRRPAAARSAGRSASTTVQAILTVDRAGCRGFATPTTGSATMPTDRPRWRLPPAAAWRRPS